MLNLANEFCWSPDRHRFPQIHLKIPLSRVATFWGNPRGYFRGHCTFLRACPENRGEIILDERVGLMSPSKKEKLAYMTSYQSQRRWPPGGQGQYGGSKRQHGGFEIRVCTYRLSR